LRSDAREHASFHHSEEETRCVESFFGFYCCVAREDNTPGKDYAELPVAGSGFFEEKVAGDFEDDVAYL
jgi:hypothetical protein